MGEERGPEQEPLLGPATPDSFSEHPSAPSLHRSRDGYGWIAEWEPENKFSVSASEVRNAVSQDPYPQWIYGAGVTSDIGHAPSAGTEPLIPPAHQPSEQGLQEDVIRELLADHVRQHCCWGVNPAKKWVIQKVEDCNVYIGTLETFVEERNVLHETEPYTGGSVDGKDKGRTPNVWELDVRKEFPLLFTPKKDARIRVPYSEVVLRCSECSGLGEVACPLCNAGQEAGTYRPGIMTECPDCYGRGLVAHLDGSDTHCEKCRGTGKLQCEICLSRGLVNCRTCTGHGALLDRQIAAVHWRTLQNRKISASSNAASVPDEIFHQAEGVELHSGQAYQCQPIQFADSYWLTKLSSDVLAERTAVPPAARIICERHNLSYVPVTRVVMSNKGKSFKFYLVGLKKEVYLKDYPSRCCGCFQSSCCIL